jgi:hypothetical protein
MGAGRVIFLPVGNMLRKLIEKLTGGEERQKLKAEYNDHLHGLSYPLHRFIGGFVAVIWLGYAFDTDPKLHPEFPELLIFRLAFTSIGFLVFALSFFQKLRGKGIGLVSLIVFSSLQLTAGLTGPIADDPNYVSGFQLVMLVTTFAPIPRRYLNFNILAGIVVFVIGVFIGKPEMNTPAVMYSMNNLFATIVLSFVSVFIQDFARFQVFSKHMEVAKQKDVIEEKMHEVQALKNKQDGDYYLTANLIKPLMVNRHDNESIKIDFLVEQYKKFSFKNRQDEIGGDLCAGHTITLRGRRYAAFMNADAMGKSIQGAGGSLVFGTVFNSVVARSHTEMGRHKYPEQWLKECFLELQGVFVEFDGSMLISAVIGLIDEETGLLYFINAEHPWVALYRDRSASFIENELALRKIGIDGLEGKLRINTWQLEPGDVLFCGSDGRDDIMLGEENGTRIINEDESLFLDHIQKAGGSLEKMKESMQELGSLTDDLSLVRIGFREDVPYKDKVDLAPTLQGRLKEAIAQQDMDAIQEVSLEVPPRNWDPETAMEYIQLLVKRKQWKDAMHYSGQISERHPDNLEFLYLTSYTSKVYFAESRDRNALVNAADYGERLRLREFHLKNLINLVDTYRVWGKIDRAEKLLAEAESRAGTTAQIRNLRELINKKRGHYVS